MDGTGYVPLVRQSGLMREMQAVAQNIANVSTTGYRRQGLVFAEHVADLGRDQPSLSLARAHAHHVDTTQGPLAETGGTFDFAIQGPGFFQLADADGAALTRAGHFRPDGTGLLSAPDGAQLLDAGGAPVFVPPGATSIVLAADGTLSVDGRPVAQIALVTPAEPERLVRQGGARFAYDGALEPVAEPAILQGYLEDSNVDPVAEIARMIEVQHAYQLGQRFLETEDERTRNVIRTLGK